MIFNSVAYAVFLPTVLLGFWLLRGRARMGLLLLASYAFYGAWDVRFLSLIWVSTAVDYVAAQRIHDADDPRTRRRWMGLSVAVNLGLLGAFKYLGFFVDSTVTVLEAAGLEVSVPVLSIALPVGISFYTFQTLGYTIDVYRRQVEPSRDPLAFATFVCFFPQLVAGPIERASHLLPQLAAATVPGPFGLEHGLRLIVRGLVMKVALADTIAPVVDAMFDDPSESGLLRVLFGATAFAFQVYGDLGGYTSIARGSALLLGVELVPNFSQPFLSGSVTETWRRWHMSLSRWLLSYVYIPLGGNRGGPRRAALNVVIVMTLGGLWHGAGWNYVLWGFTQGLFLAWERGSDPNMISGLPTLRQLPRVIRAFSVFVLGLVFFRSPSMSELGAVAWAAVRGEFGALPSLGEFAVVAVAAGILLLQDLYERTHPVSERAPSSLRLGILLGAAVVALIITSGAKGPPFIYFQF